MRHAVGGLIFSLCLMGASSVQSAPVTQGELDLGGFSATWTGQYSIHSVTTLGPLDINPPPDFENNDVVSTVVDFNWSRPLVLEQADDGVFIPLPLLDIRAKEGWAITEISTYFVGNFVSTGQAELVPQQNTAIAWFGREPSSVDLEQSIWPLSKQSSSYWLLSDNLKPGKSCSEPEACIGFSHVTVDMSKSFKASITSPDSSLVFAFAQPYDSGFTKQWIMVKTERIAPVPEPGSLVLMCMGIGALGVARRRVARKR